jgi:4,5-DOPA dioxygenase extradiol
MKSLFVSHGAPNLVLHPSEARSFMQSWGLGDEMPRAILVVSAHFNAAAPTLTADARPDMIYDFGGFEPELRDLVYPAPGSPEVAQEAARLLEAAGFGPLTVTGRGFDHGTWVPLMLMRPQADIPVVQLSVDPRRDADYHYRIGLALAPLAASGVMVIGSGAATHNLRELFGRGYAIDAPAPDWVRAFGDWLDERIEAGDREALIAWQDKAPYARENHPTTEHLLPLYVAMGAAGEAAVGKRVHASHQYGVLMMDCYSFQ